MYVGTCMRMTVIFRLFCKVNYKFSFAGFPSSFKIYKLFKNIFHTARTSYYIYSRTKFILLLVLTHNNGKLGGFACSILQNDCS